MTSDRLFFEQDQESIELNLVIVKEGFKGRVEDVILLEMIK